MNNEEWIMTYGWLVSERITVTWPLLLPTCSQTYKVEASAVNSNSKSNQRQLLVTHCNAIQRMVLEFNVKIHKLSHLTLQVEMVSTPSQLSRLKRVSRVSTLTRGWVKCTGKMKESFKGDDEFYSFKHNIYSSSTLTHLESLDPLSLATSVTPQMVDLYTLKSQVSLVNPLHHHESDKKSRVWRSRYTKSNFYQ